jgi:hypothetical protein
MSNLNREPRRAAAIDLQTILEPLASYICATEQPKKILDLVYAALFNEVAQVNRAAAAQVVRRTPKSVA